MKLVNKSNRDMSKLNPFVKDFLPFAQKYMKFDKLPTIMYYSDQDNAAKTLGRTAYYDPSANQVVLYVDNRHPKDIMRSLSHELVHHKQNCGGHFKGGMAGEQGYAQNDPHLREMEREAYELGNMCFRDWEDTRRDYLQENNYYKGEKSKMSLKDWKNKELNRLLFEKWGYKLNEGGMYNRAEEEEEEQDEMQEGAASSSRGEHDDRNGDDERKRPLEEDEKEDMAQARKQRKDRERHQRQIREDDDAEAQEKAEKKAVKDNKPNPGGMKGRIKGMLGLEERIHKAIKEAIMELKS